MKKEAYERMNKTKDYEEGMKMQSERKLKIDGEKKNRRRCDRKTGKQGNRKG
jgi:hypothetical protein